MTAMLAGSAAGLQALIDSVVDYAPICLRERTLLQAVDWSKVSAEKVAFMLGRLETDFGSGAELAREIAAARRPRSAGVAADQPSILRCMRSTASIAWCGTRRRLQGRKGSTG